MKIAILGPVTSKDFYSLIKKKDKKNLPKGHGPSHLSNLALSLVEYGHTVSVISLSEDIANNKVIISKNKNLKLYFCPLRKSLFRLRGLLYRKEVKYLAQAIEIDNPDLVHANWIYEYAFAAEKSKKKYILTNHDIPHVILKYQKTLFRIFRFFMGYFSLKKAKIITTPSKYAKLQTQKYTNTSIKVIPNTSLKKNLIDSKIKKKIINKKLNIVMINNGFTSFKNVKIALEAFKKFNEFSPKSSLCLFGHEMQNNASCHKWAKNNNLDKNVIFYGYIENIKLIKIFHNFDVLLHTSLEETFGNIYLEAMIRGVPIIAGKNSGATPEIIKKNGLLINVKKCEQIVDALKKYLQNPILWKKIRYKAFNYAKRNYNNKKIIKNYLRLYKKTLKKSHE